MAKRSEEDIAMRPKGIRRLLNQRFVQTVEVFGYLLCSLIGLGLAYSLYVKVDVVVPCEGTLAIPSSEITAPDQLTVTAWAAEAGRPVATGAALCSYVSDPAQRDRARARTLLAQSVVILAKDPDPGAKAAADICKHALEAVSGVDAYVSATAPKDGVLIPAPAALPGAVLAKDALLARVVDLSQLELNGALVGGPAAEVEQGNPVTVTDGLTGAKLTGEVASVTKEGNAAELTLKFSPLPQELAEKYKQEAMHPETATPPARVKAFIVVGQQSLFNSVFGRR